MNNKDLKEVVQMSSEIGLSQAKLAGHMNITDNYWFKIRTGRAPLTSEVMSEIQRLKKKMKAFMAA